MSTSYDFDGIVPLAVGEEAAYFDFCRNRHLMIQHCGSCGCFVFYPRSVCPECLAPGPEWIEAAGTGAVFTFTVHHREAAGFAGQAPYVVAVIELDEGVRMLSRIVADPESIRIGDRVQVAWATIDQESGFTVPVFVPLEAGHG